MSALVSLVGSPAVAQPHAVVPARPVYAPARAAGPAHQIAPGRTAVIAQLAAIEAPAQPVVVASPGPAVPANPRNPEGSANPCAPVASTSAVVPPTPFRFKPSLIAALAVTGAGLVSGAFFGVQALAESNLYAMNPTMATRDRGILDATVADMSFLVAGIGAVLSLVLYLTEPAAEPVVESEPMMTRRSPSIPRFRAAPNGLVVIF